MLGCLVVNHVKVNSHSNSGKMMLIAVTDVLLTKLNFSEWHHEDKSDELYMSRFDYFSKKMKKETHDINISSWFHLAMVPIGLSAKSLDEAQSEAKRCLRILKVNDSKKLEGEILASLIFLGKEGVNKEAIPYFLKAEYQIEISSLKNSLGHTIKSLMKCDTFESFIDEVHVYKRPSYRMMCGGIGQAYYKHLPSHWVNPTLDHLEDDIKSMSLSFMKTFDCYPTW